MHFPKALVASSALGALALVVTSMAAPARAATVYVPSEQPTIQAGVDAAGDSGTVVVAPDTYTGPGNREIDFAGMSVTLESSGNAFDTVIDCEGAHRAFYFHSGEDTTCVVDGFTITNCVGGYGGAIRCQNASPTIRNCIFSSNEAANGGGAFHSDSNSAPRFEICTFEYNSAQFGGAVQMDGSGGSLWNCRFEGNTASLWGGAAYLRYIAETDFDYCDFTGNDATLGGAVYSVDAESDFLSCTLTGNEANSGGAIFVQTNYNQPTFTGCTIAYNQGGALYVQDGSPVVTRSILAFDRTGCGVTCTGIGEPEFSHCCVFGNAGGDSLSGIFANNMFEDPLFCAMSSGNVDLCSNSTCLPHLNPWSELVGSRPSGCPNCDSPVERASWGAIKGMYRTVD